MNPASLPLLPAYFANGQLRQQTTMVDLHDRGLAYGDGVFETMLARDGKIVFWQNHQQRLHKGLEFLGITLDCELFQTHWQKVCRHLANIDHACVVKLMVTRGVSARGYLPSDTSAHVFTSISPLSLSTLDQTGCSVHLCKEILAEPVSWAGLKTLSQLSYVLASKERMHTRFDEGLLCSGGGHIIEATARNIFAVKNNMLFTPDLSRVGVAGVMREIILDNVAPKLKLNTQVVDLTLSELLAADEIFLCNSVTEIWPVTAITHIADNDVWHWPIGETTLKIQYFIKGLISQPH